MTTPVRAVRRRTAMAMILTLLLPSGVGPVPLSAGQPPSAATPSSAKPSSAQPTAPALVDGVWPRSYVTATGARLAVFQPQVASWNNQAKMTLYSAVSYTAKAADKAVFGTVKAEADTRVSITERLVDFSAFKITESNFPTLSKEQTMEIVGEITRSMPHEDRVIALDRVLTSIDKSQILPKNVEGVKADPPVIFF